MLRVQTIEQRLARLEAIVLAEQEWQPMKKAAEQLGCSIALLSLRAKEHPKAKWWRWNHSKTRRQINVRLFKEAFKK